MENSRPRNKEAENNNFLNDSTNNISLDSPASATTSSKPTEHFLIAVDLQKLLDISKDSSQSSSFIESSLRSNNISSIIYDKALNASLKNLTNNDLFRSHGRVAFDLEVSDDTISKDLNLYKLHDEAKKGNTRLNSHLRSESVTTILSSEFPLEDSKNLSFSSGFQKTFPAKYSQPVIDSSKVKLNQVVNDSYESQYGNRIVNKFYAYEDGEDIIRILENPSGEDFFEDLYSDPEFASKELKEFEQFIKLKYNCPPENVSLNNDITDYVDSPDYLEDLYGLPELYEFLKKSKSTEVSKLRVKALERLTLIKAHLE